MSANLTPQYRKAEREYRRAQTPPERIECLERMLRLIPKHKGTDKLQAGLKTRLKEARAELQAEKESARTGPRYRIPRQGAGQVVVIGAPNSGKSRIVAELTNAALEVASYPFTTREPFPAIMTWEDVTVQLVDMPPITDNSIEPYMASLVRSTDVVVLCFDGSSDDAPAETATVITELESRKTRLANETTIDDEDFSIFRMKTLLVVTQADDTECEDRLNFFRSLAGTPFEILKVELDRKDSVEQLRNCVYQSLNVIRIYTKRPGQPPDYESPFTIGVHGTVEELAFVIHRELADSFKFARVWGTGVHDGQKVGRDHRLFDRDLVELH